LSSLRFAAARRCTSGEQVWKFSRRAAAGFCVFEPAPERGAPAAMAGVTKYLAVLQKNFVCPASGGAIATRDRAEQISAKISSPNHNVIVTEAGLTKRNLFPTSAA